MKMYQLPIKYDYLREISKKKYERNTYPFSMENNFGAHCGRHLVSRELPTGAKLVGVGFAIYIIPVFRKCKKQLLYIVLHASNDI